MQSKHLHSGVSYKRLEQGRFHWPEAKAGETKVVLSHEELSWLLNGMDRVQVKRRRNWYREVTSEEPSEISV